MIQRWVKLICKIFFIFLVPTGFIVDVWANLPFNADDPTGLYPKQIAVYLSAVYSKAILESFETEDAVNVAVPGVEVDLGLNRRLLVRVSTGFAFDATSTSKPPDENPVPILAGITDTEIGAKYVIFTETAATPQLSIAPVFIAPTGNARRNLGNGTPWAKVPIWAQKTFGKWTIHAGGGWAFNQALGEQNYAFGGWEAERVMNDSLTLGGALLLRGQNLQNGQTASVLTLGGMYYFTKNLSLLFAGGHSIFAERRSAAYLGLNWSSGRGEPQQNELKPLLMNRSVH